MTQRNSAEVFAVVLEAVVGGNRLRVVAGGVKLVDGVVLAAGEQHRLGRVNRERRVASQSRLSGIRELVLGHRLAAVTVEALAHVPDLDDAVGVAAADQRVSVLKLDGRHAAARQRCGAERAEKTSFRNFNTMENPFRY